MKSLHEFFFWLGGLGVLAVFLVGLMWVMLRRPAQWKSLMALEDAFWSWLISPAFAESLKRLEERMKLESILKGLVVIVAVFSVGSFLFFTVWFVWAHVLPRK